MNLLVIVLFSFLAAMTLIIVMFFVPMAVQNSPHARIKRRLTTVGRAGYTSRADAQNLLKSSLYSEVPWVNALLSRVPVAKHLDLLLERANVDMTLGLFILCSLVASGVAIFLFLIVGQPFSLAVVVGLLALGCPYFYLKYITWRRLRRFLEQLPDALDMMSQSLQAGLGLTQAMVFVAKEMPDPLGTEFSVFIEEVNLGLPLADALKKLEERMVLPEVRLFSTALLVQRDVGGSGNPRRSGFWKSGDESGPYEANRGGVREALLQRVSIYPVRGQQSVLHDGARRGVRLPPHRGRPQGGIPAHGRVPRRRLHGGSLPAQRHAATRSLCQ